MDLGRWIAANEGDLLRVLGPFARRVCAARGLSVDETTRELLVEVTGRALTRQADFDPARPPRAWLIGIAANVVRRWSEQKGIQNRRTAHALEPGTAQSGDAFDRLIAAAATPGAHEEALANVRVEQLLQAAATPEDRNVLQLALVEDLDMATVGRSLKISPGAARVRLHRALRRLRAHLDAEGVRA